MRDKQTQDELLRKVRQHKYVDFEGNPYEVEFREHPSGNYNEANIFIDNHWCDVISPSAHVRFTESAMWIDDEAYFYV